MKYKRAYALWWERMDSTCFCFAKSSLSMLCFGRGWIRRAFASQNHSELLPQLLSLKTVHRTVFLTLQPKGSNPALSRNEKQTTLWSSVIHGGRGWIRTTEGTTNRFTVCPLWPLGNSPLFSFAPRGPRTEVRRFGGRRSSGVSKFCRLRRNERFVADSDVELVDGLEPPTC